MMPNTDHFELDSARVGARLGIWVTKPPTYAQGNQYVSETADP
jgi:hypothetical protein